MQSPLVVQENSFCANLEVERTIPRRHRCLYLTDVHGQIMFQVDSVYPIFRYTLPDGIDVNSTDDVDAWAATISRAALSDEQHDDWLLPFIARHSRNAKFVSNENAFVCEFIARMLESPESNDVEVGDNVVGGVQ